MKEPKVKVAFSFSQLTGKLICQRSLRPALHFVLRGLTATNINEFYETSRMFTEDQSIKQCGTVSD